jgi:hypothetical protein
MHCTTPSRALGGLSGYFGPTSESESDCSKFGNTKHLIFGTQFFVSRVLTSAQSPSCAAPFDHGGHPCDRARKRHQEGPSIGTHLHHITTSPPQHELSFVRCCCRGCIGYGVVQWVLWESQCSAAMFPLHRTLPEPREPVVAMHAQRFPLSR